jgi:hypothetical protein
MFHKFEYLYSHIKELESSSSAKPRPQAGAQTVLYIFGYSKHSGRTQFFFKKALHTP